MVKNCVIWAPVIGKSVRNSDVALRTAEIIDVYLHGTLLSRILSMPRKNPITLETAVGLVVKKQQHAFLCGSFGHELGQYSWYYKHFVEWISEQGFHIEMTGEEFELAATPSLAA